MKCSLPLAVVLATAGACKSEVTAPAQGSATPEPTAPPAGSGSAAAPNPDGVPDTVRIVPGGTLLTKRENGNVRVWVYGYANGEPLAFAEQQSKSLEATGWKTIIRKKADDRLPPPVYAVFGTRDGQLAVAETYSAAPGVELKLVLEPMHGLTLDPPDGYPEGFPFLPFGIPYTPKTQTASKGSTLVYNGELAAMQAELAAATKNAGWDCPSATFAQLTLCTKDGKEVFLRLSSLSPNRQSLIVATEQTE